MRRTKVIYNSLTSLILQFITIISGLIIPKLIIENYGSDVNGIISSVTQFLSYIVLLEAGIGGVARSVLYKPLAQKDNVQISKIIVSVQKFFRKIAYFFLLYLLFIAIIFKYISNVDFNYWFTFSIVIIIGISNFIQYYFALSYQILLQADQRQYITTTTEIITIFVNTILTYFMIKMGLGIICVKIISAIVYVIRPFIIYYYVNKKYNIDKKCNSEKFELKQKWDGLAQHIAFFLHTNTDIVIITIFMDVVYVSIYSVYFMISTGLRSLVSTINAGTEALFGDMLANNEIENLKKSFNFMEFLISTVAIICFTTGFLLIDDFVIIYTKNVIDVNYSIPCLGYMLLLAETVYCIRQPYHCLVIAAGHFKETKMAAFLEAGINIILSIILINVLGIVGVAIATVVATTYRTIFYVFYLNKNIINKPKKDFFVKRLITLIVIFLSSVLIFRYFIILDVNNFMMWIIKGLIVFIIISIIAILTNFIFYFDQQKNIINSIKSKLKKV